MKNKFGFGLIEIVVSTAVLFIALFVLFDGIIFFLRASNVSNSTQQAVFLSKEGIEAVRFLRDMSWSSNISSLSTASGSNAYYAVGSGSAWILTSADPGPISGKFNRTIVFWPVNRDLAGNIVDAGGSNDPNTRKITVNITWINENGNSQVYYVSAYLTNFLNN